MSSQNNTETIDQLAKDIFQILTVNANKFRSVYSLYNEYILDSKNKYVTKRDFSLTCELLNTYYKNIDKKYYDNICYVVFVTDPSHLSNDDREQIKNASMKEDNEFNSLDKCDVFEYMINNPKFCENISLKDYCDGNDTILHLLTRKNKYDMMVKISNLYDVDFDVKNKNGESVLDVINYNDLQNAMKIVKLITSYQVNKYQLKNSLVNESVKKQNTSLAEQNKELRNEVTSLTKHVKETESSKKIVNYFVFVVVAMYMYLVYLYLSRTNHC
jgi:hypothetical protein